MNERFTIVVNSNDTYEDCWEPFFILFNKFWPNCRNPILLNSDTKIFQFPSLNIICPTVSRVAGKNYQWGDRFLKSLKFVNTEILLLTAVDLFIKAPVRVDIINDLVDLMYRDDLTHILLYSNPPGPNDKCPYPMLLERGQHSPYRLSLHIGLWRKERLKFYLRGHENPWQAEIWGTKRAWQVKDSFYCIDKSYEQTYGKVTDVVNGIVKGKWFKAEGVVDLFRQNDIEMDFSIRGFFEDSMITFPQRLKRKLLWLPSDIRSWLDLHLMNV